MIRRIYCGNCAKYGMRLDPEDVANGWQQRRVELLAKVPKDHNIIVNEQIHPLEMLRCDLCSGPMPDGSKVVAITNWRVQHGEPAEWESGYGEKV